MWLVHVTLSKAYANSASSKLKATKHIEMMKKIGSGISQTGHSPARFVLPG
jgi:hypothetical protein